MSPIGLRLRSVWLKQPAPFDPQPKAQAFTGSRLGPLSRRQFLLPLATQAQPLHRRLRLRVKHPGPFAFRLRLIELEQYVELLQWLAVRKRLELAAKLPRNSEGERVLRGLGFDAMAFVTALDPY